MKRKLSKSQRAAQRKAGARKSIGPKLIDYPEYWSPQLTLRAAHEIDRFLHYRQQIDTPENRVMLKDLEQSMKARGFLLFPTELEKVANKGLQEALKDTPIYLGNGFVDSCLEKMGDSDPDSLLPENLLAPSGVVFFETPIEIPGLQKVEEDNDDEVNQFRGVSWCLHYKDRHNKGNAFVSPFRGADYVIVSLLGDQKGHRISAADEKRSRAQQMSLFGTRMALHDIEYPVVKSFPNPLPLHGQEDYLKKASHPKALANRAPLQALLTSITDLSQTESAVRERVSFSESARRGAGETEKNIIELDQIYLTNPDQVR